MGLQGSSLQCILFGKIFDYKAFLPKAQSSHRVREAQMPIYSTEGPCRQDHSSMNAWVLSNLPFKLWQN
jgi:hypothetical protein